MNINRNLGQKIIKRIEEYVDVDINIMDLTGKIVASTDENRINEIHSGAIEVIKTNSELILFEDDVINYEGAKPGANLPIIHLDKIEGVVGVSGNPDEILSMTGLIRVSVEIIIDQMYNQRQEYYKERQWSHWLQQLLHPAGLNEEGLRRDANYTLQTDMDAFWQVIVFYGDNVQDYLENYRQWVDNKHILFILPFSDDEVIVTVSSLFENIPKFINDLLVTSEFKAHVGVGKVGHSVKGIRDSYLQAKQAVEFQNEEGTIAYIKDWGLERLAHSISDEIYNEFCLRYEQRLLSLNDIYIETINTYFEMNFSIKLTSDILHIHRNTLLYRLEQVYIKVELNPRIFSNAFILQLIISRNV